MMRRRKRPQKQRGPAHVRHCRHWRQKNRQDPQKPVAIDTEDQHRALVLDDAALEAVKSGRAVRV
jgi:hypothetical protein